MEFFDVGHLLVLGVVAVVLVVYRQLDKNNRTLERVRRYADAVRSDLETFVQQRTLEVKDFGVELEVHQKTGREILKRIKAVEDDLQSRLPQVEELKTRIDDYGSRIQSLQELTGTVDENLERLRQESEFLDKVGRRLKAATEEIHSLESRIPQLREQFDLEASQQKGEFQHLIQSVRADIGKSRQEELSALGAAGNAERLHLAQEAKALQENHLKQKTEIESWWVQTAQQAAKLNSEVFQKLQAQIATEAQTYEQRWQDHWKKTESGLQAQAQELQKFGEDLQRNAAETESALSRELEDLSERWESLKARWEKEHHEKLTALGKEAAQRFLSLKQESEQVSKDLSQELKLAVKLKEQAAAESAELHAKLKAFADEFSAKAAAAGLAAERKAIAAVEAQLKASEQNLSTRLTRLEGIENEIGQVEGHLRQALERNSARVEEEFRLFDQRMQERRLTEQTELLEQFQQTRHELKSLETELEDLKTRAYDNVSEKLQVFEDQFFQDLQKRSADINQNFEDWQSRVRERLGALETQAEEARQTSETVLLEQIRKAQLALQATVSNQAAKQEQVLAQTIEAQTQRMNQVRSELDQSLGALKQEIEASLERFHQDTETNLDLREQLLKDSLSKSDKDFEARLKALQERMEIQHKDSQTVLETFQSDLGLWQSRALQRVKEIDGNLSEQFAGFRTQIQERIQILREEFLKTTQDLVTGSQEQRIALKQQLDSLADQVSALGLELTEQGTKASDQVKRDFELVQTDLQKRLRDLSNEMELRVRDFRQQVQDTREKGEALQKKLFGNVEDRTHLLTLNLDEIDKRSKAFLAQTKLFERADALKLDLEESIEGLKGDLARMDLQRREVAEVENQIGRIRKMTEDVSDRVTKFLAEKKRIDSLDADFQKVLSLSQTMETRLRDVTSNSDLLQDIQVKIRRLEEAEKDVELRFERLEKKKEVLELTSEGVDRNFAQLERMEKSVRELSTTLSTLPGDLEELRKRYRSLTAQKEEIDQALQRTQKLQELMNDVETRSAKLEQARDWLARTETRLEEVSREADEQVKLLGTLVKASPAGSAKLKGGAPSLDNRQTVLKLASQGWNKEEIARAVKLSLGEVELILELGSR